MTGPLVGAGKNKVPARELPGRIISLAGMITAPPQPPTFLARVPRAVPHQPFHALTLGVFALLITLVTLLKSRFEIAGLWDAAAHQQRSLDLELFNGFIDPVVWYGPLINTFGNTALFIPLGFLLHLLLRHRVNYPILTVFLSAAAVSLGIEVTQFLFALGYSDVDDLLTNSLGGLGGALLAARMRSKGQLGFSLLTLLSSLGVLAVAGVGRVL
ncbi:VanZ like family protein [Corynebacterium occultum]|uniref:VanZ like family protein n=2 Tax=Corynebacterium occultum TaxID=2675219 RepID=A0A6B8VWX8_9CORY|nr:VanZ like family protein [Corynebacterium occultum]